GHGLWHERADHPALASELSGRHAEENHPIGRGHCVCKSEVDFELPIGVFVIDLIYVQSNSAQSINELLDKCATARQSLVVIAWFVQRIGLIGGTRHSAAIARQEHEFRLHACVERPSTLL